MKIINFSKITLIAITLTSMLGCSEDFLEQTNPNSISTSIYWKTIEDLNTGLSATYKAFGRDNNYNLADEIARADLAWSSGFQRPNNTNPYYLQIFNNAAQIPNLKWTSNYTGIFRANQVILASEKLLGTFSSQADNEKVLSILAQARFIRGYLYFNLHNSFNNGAVPIFDYVPENEAEFYQPVQTSDSVRSFYLKDLKYASENLPISWAGPEKGRVTAGAAVAVMGQSYLYAKDYENAAKYFKKVINDYGYSLTPNIGSNFTTMDEYNSESIIELGFSMVYKNELGPWDSRDVANTSGLNKKLTGANGQWFGAVLANWLILEYRKEIPDFSDPRNKISLANGTTKFRKFSLRTSWSVALVDDEDMPYYLSPKTGQASNFNVRMTAFWRKHTNWDIAKSEDLLSPGKVRSGINERLLRLAEIYLNYAECMIETGNLDEALLYVNKVRRRSGVQLLGPVGSGEYPSNDHDNVTYSLATLKEHLRYKEYPLELSCEGNGATRNVDLRRWGVKSQRFKDLAAKRYAADHYDVILENGTKVTRWESIVKELPANDPNVSLAWSEFQEAANNYTDELSYWPMPNSEIITNPSLYK